MSNVDDNPKAFLLILAGNIVIKYHSANNITNGVS